LNVIVLGGYGNFGRRICRALAADSNVALTIAGRDAAAAAALAQELARSGMTCEVVALDHRAADFATRLRELRPGLVIHTAGPFQGQTHHVARAAIDAGAHYLDLADGRAFVKGIVALDAGARERGVIVTSGASTLPALSTAVIDHLAFGLARVDAISISIAPGQAVTRGLATMEAVLSCCGRPFDEWRGGQWVRVFGWQGLHRLCYPELGTRWGARCDVPDLELLPRLYPEAHTVEFRAALELGTQQSALWLAAFLRRSGMKLPLERWSGVLARVASGMNALGGQLAGMLVSVSGKRADGSRARAEWHLTADALDGPEIPCMPTVLLARKLANGGIAQRGAFPCIGFLSLPEFEREFARWRITTVMRELSTG